MSPKRIGHTYVTAFGESVLLAERDEVQRVAEAHESRSTHGILASRSTSFPPIIFQP
jgi:hypothetical protein